MEIVLESTGIKVKGNCVIQELQPLQKIMLDTIESERSSVQIDLSEVAYIGDDINCFELLSKVGYPGCPNDAVRQIKNITNIYISPKNGGDGCVRDFIDKLLNEL